MLAAVDPHPLFDPSLQIRELCPDPIFINRNLLNVNLFWLSIQLVSLFPENDRVPPLPSTRNRRGAEAQEACHFLESFPPGLAEGN